MKTKRADEHSVFIGPEPPAAALVVPLTTDDTIHQLGMEVNKVESPQTVLFPDYEPQTSHRNDLQAVLTGLPIPEGGPFCICSPQAVLAVRHGAGVQCAELPWSCPYAKPKE